MLDAPKSNRRLSSRLVSLSALFGAALVARVSLAQGADEHPTQAPPTENTGGDGSGGAAPTGGAGGESPGPTETPAEKPESQPAKPAEDPKSDKAAAKPEKPKEDHGGSFEFGSYGRMIVAANGDGGPGADSDIVGRGSRMDEGNYVELELRREDDWGITGIYTNVVATLAFASPIFHYDADFDVKMAIRNMYLEARNIGLTGLSAWAGSRMVRGDDIYLLDYWPLDNLNLLGAGASYAHESGFSAALSVGATQPKSEYFSQTVERPAPLDQFGAVPVELLDRQKFIGAVRLSHNQRLGPKDLPSPGIKATLYAEGHALPEGTRETEPGGELELLPSDGGFAVGAEFTAYTGERDTYVNVFLRYAGNLAAYGQFTTPGQLTLEHTTDGAREVVVALGGNAEYEFFGIQAGAYFRSFRDASPQLNYEDVDEGAIILRPTFFFGELAGLSIEGAFEAAQRGVIAEDAVDPSLAPSGPLVATAFRLGFMPFIAAAGRGDFKRPHLRLIYNLTVRDDGARLLYPEDHPYRDRSIEHFIGIGAEWWFNSSSYGN